jgi:ligand-binding sensor domain-containing protein
MKHQPIFLFLLFLFGQTLPAQQNPQFHFRNYSTEHGLPSPETYCAFQDSRGYMWFGTDNGASRFDGYEFRAYSAQEGLTSNVIFDIFEDAKGRIWFGTMTGEAFILEGDTIVPYRFNHLVKRYREKFLSASLACLLKDETVFFELRGLGIMQIDSLGRDSLIATERPNSLLMLEVEGSSKLLHTEVARTYEEDFISWFADQNQHQKIQMEFLTKADKFRNELPLSLEDKTGLNAQLLSSGHLLAFWGNQLYCLQENKILWILPFAIQTSEIIEDEQAIWVCGLYGNGLRRYRNLEAIKNGDYDLFLDGLSISNTYRDAKGGLWVTTLEQGVFYCSDLDLLTYDSRFGFSENFVSAVAFKNEQELFVGCENGDIFQVDLAQSRVKGVTTNPYGYHNFDLLYLSDLDALWSSTTYWKDEQWHFAKISYPGVNGLMNLKISKFEKLHLNASGDLLGCHSLGFLIIDLKNDTVRFASYLHIPRERTLALHTDKKQRLWVGNLRGLFEFRDSVLVSTGIDHPAFHIRVEDIDELPDGSLVFGTKGLGVVRWKGEDMLQLTIDEGLSSNMIEDVHVDENGILWVGTLNGLNKITFDNNGKPTVRPFTIANGLPSNEIYKVKSYAGQVWLCTAGGLIKFHEREKETVADSPIIQDLKVNGGAVSLADRQEFKHRQNNLEFRFLAINYHRNGRIPYRYRLSKTAAWQYTQNLIVNYPQLPPDDYHFEVQAQNQDGYWSLSTAFAFTIHPPWWNTWLARGPATVFLLAGLFYYQRQYIARLRKEAAIQQQITDLEHAALQAQMNPHFIFNCLNSIQNFILTNEKRQAVEFLARFARLVRHNLNASVQGRVSLEEEVRILNDYLALERERFQNSIDYHITVEESLEKEEIFFPPLLIQPYVENAVIHGLAKKAGGGMVEIHFGREKGSLAVSIRDNGVGYRVNGEEKQSARHKSVGMSITQQRLALLSETAGRPVEIEVLRDAEGVVLGTEVRLWLQIGGEEA